MSSALLRDIDQKLKESNEIAKAQLAASYALLCQEVCRRSSSADLRSERIWAEVTAKNCVHQVLGHRSKS